MSIGEKIRQLRMARGWSQGQLEYRAGMKGGYISLVESGKRNPKPETLGKIAGAFGITLEELLTGESGSSLLQGERGLAIYTDREQPMIRTILTAIQNIEPYVEDVSGLFEMWAALPPALMIAVADIIHVEFLRSQLADSGKVTRAQPGRRRTKAVPFTPWDVLAPTPGQAKILGKTEEEITEEQRQNPAAG